MNFKTQKLVAFGLLLLMGMFLFAGCASDYEAEAIKEIDEHGTKMTNIFMKFTKYACLLGALTSSIYYFIDQSDGARLKMRIAITASVITYFVISFMTGSFI